MEIKGSRIFALIVFATLSFLLSGYYGIYSFSGLSYGEVFVTKDFLLMLFLTLFVLLWSLRFITTLYVRKDSDFK